MEEAAMFSIASNLLSKFASPAFQMAYQKALSIWEPADALDKLRRRVQRIQAVLRDAEKKKEDSAAIKDWIERVSDVLYDADDLFDEIATDEMLKLQQIKGDKPLKMVRAFPFNKLNPIVSTNSIANKVKAIKKSLLEISYDMAQFKFVAFVDEQKTSNIRKGKDLGYYVHSKDVIGRDDDKETIIELLLNDKSNNGEQDVSIIAIVGIGGMGKTTLAQLVHSDKEVENKFEKRWFVSISDTTDNTEIIGKIFQSICKKNYGDITLDQQQTEISESIEGVKFLLVLDDVWDADRASWQQHRISLLRSGATGSKIIVTTRSLSVANAVGALETHTLKGLSENESWDLFKGIAFTPEQEKDRRWGNIGRKIVKKCVNVPLAIRSVASLLCTKHTIQEWESFKDNELSKVELSGDSVIQTLRLSYDHLPFNLKPCFAYCSLFPKDHIFDRDELIYLWIAQGYIKPDPGKQTIEQVGYSYFMELHKRCFFEKRDYYRMHDLIHDLAQCVAGEKIIMLTKPPTQSKKRAQHISIGLDVDTSHMLNTNQLRSLLYLPRRRDKYEDPQFTYGKYLRALSLSKLRIEIVSSSIGELKHLRYLNMSGNSFKRLPNSLTNLLNLLTLDIRECRNLEALPDSFRKLISLRHLNIKDCGELKHMPPGMEELSSLQKLSDFKVGKTIEGVKRSGLDALAGLKLKGELTIDFDDGIANWDGEECLQLPASLEQLIIFKYPGWRIVLWCNTLSLLPCLARLTLINCCKVKHLSRLRCLPNLKFLALDGLEELEYIEDEEEEEDDGYTVTTGYFENTALFFPLLEELEMCGLEKLKGWSRRKVAATPASSTGSWSPDLFLSLPRLSQATTASSTGSWSPDLFLSLPRLSQLTIEFCGKLTSFPVSPCVRTLRIVNVDGDGLVSALDQTFPSLKICSIFDCRDLEDLQLLGSRFLEELRISDCDRLTRVNVETLPSLIYLEIGRCERLKSLRIATLDVLSEIRMWECPKELDWSVNWNSLPNLRRLRYNDMLFPSPDELLNCLRYQEQPGALNLPPRKEIRPASASSPAEIIPVLKQEPASIPLTHRPDTDATGWENRGAAYKEVLDKQEAEIIEFKHTNMIDEAEHQNIDASNSQEVPYNLSIETDKDEFMSPHEATLGRKGGDPLIMEEAEECLYILSLLPKDYEFEEDMLIQLWMAGGHIKDETTGNKHFSHLLNQKYLLRSGTNFFTSKGRYHINIETCQKISHFSEGQNNTLKSENECDTDKCSAGIQHVSLVFNGVDHTIFQKLQQFSDLRTLLFLANDCPLVKEIPAHFFQRFEKLRALDLSGTHIKNLPSSVGHMHHLRYLDLSRTLIEWLPDTICFLKELQTLKLQECSKLRELPEQLSNLTELRDLDVDVLCRLTIMPKGMKALRNLRTLSAFLVGTEDGYKVNELECLNNLTGDFCIAKLENVGSADEAKNAALGKKMKIKRLVLRWTAPEYSWKANKSDASAVLERLEPCPFLEKLQILCYQGSTFPSWVSNPQFEKLVHVSFRKCENVCKLPPLEQLPFLKDLELVEMNSVEAFEVQGRSDMIAFRSLEKLRIDEMLSLRTWRLVKQNDDDFKSLTEITINDCPRLRKFDVLPHLSSIKYLEIRKCPKVQSVSNSDLPKSLDVLMVDNFYVIRKNSMTSEDDDETEASYISSDDL